MKALITMALLFTLMNAETLKKIETQSPEVNQDSSQQTKKEKKVDSIERIELQVFSNIKYNKGMETYSIIPHDKDSYKSILADKKIDSVVLKNLYGRVDNIQSILYSAYGYDYAYEKPELAENFYLLFDKKFEMDTKDKIKKADFLLRTGRPEMIKDVLSKRDCMASLQYNSQCFYYIGLSEYLQTGDKKNALLRLVKDKIPKAKEIISAK